MWQGFHTTVFAFIEANNSFVRKSLENGVCLNDATPFIKAGVVRALKHDADIDAAIDGLRALYRDWESVYAKYASVIYAKLCKQSTIYTMTTPFFDNGLIGFAGIQRDEALRCLSVCQVVATEADPRLADEIASIIASATAACGTEFDADVVKNATKELLTKIYEGQIATMIGRVGSVSVVGAIEEGKAGRVFQARNAASVALAVAISDVDLPRIKCIIEDAHTDILAILCEA